MAWLRVLAWLAAALLMWAAVARPAVAQETAKTLARLHEPVVVSTELLAGLPDRRTANLRLYRIEGGQLLAIPFQFDARDLRGDVVVDGEPEFEFDDNDELVFMVADTGDQAAPDRWPTGCDAAVEIEVIDPLLGERGWAYLLHFPGVPPPPAAERYVSFDGDTNQARSAFYEVDYASGRNFYTGLRIPRAAGGSGANLLRQTRMRGSPTLSLFLTDLTFEFTEQNSIVEIDGVRTGPVRAVRRVRLFVDLGSLFPDLPNGTVYTYHYRSAYVTPTRFGVPWLALKTLRDFQFEAVIDFAPGVMPMRYWDGANRHGLTLAGETGAPVETSVDHDWWVNSGDAGTMLHAFAIPEQWKLWGIVRGTVLKNGPAAASDAGRQPQEAVYAAGYSLLHMTNLREARTYDLLQAAIVLPRPYRIGDEIEPMAMLRAPVRAAVRRVR